MSFPELSFTDLAAPGIADLAPYQPGKPVSEIAREYGVSDVVKLASNENPLGPSPKALAAAREAAAEAHRYPDGAAYELRERVAAEHNVAPEQITFGNGSNDCLDLIARCFLAPGRSAVYARHAFAIYAIATRSAGADAIAARARPETDAQPLGHDLDAMADAITGDTRVVFVANPNNPTGTWESGEAIERFLERVPSEVVVVLDEAYIEYAREAEGYVDGRRWLEAYPNLVLVRTFSKGYGLPGLRVGYALSSPEIADLLNRVRHPFNVNAVAQAAAVAALDDGDHVAQAVVLNREQRPRLARGCRELGLGVLPSAGNFICVDTGGDADAVHEALLREGVIVRPLGGYQLPQHLRVSVGTGEENDRLLTALANLRSANRLPGVV
jgi:histidinol-phosphate aminotransferase